MPPLDPVDQRCANCSEIVARILFHQNARQHSGRKERIGNDVMLVAQHARRHSIKYPFAILGKNAQGYRFQLLRRDKPFQSCSLRSPSYVRRPSRS